MSRVLTSISAGLVLGTGTASALAVEEVAPMYYEIDGWEMVAIIDENVVNSLFLFRVDPAPDPNNINGIWAQRGIGGDWFADAWPGSTRGEVVMWAVANLGLDDPLLDRDAWPMDWVQGEAVGAMPAPMPVPYGDGLAVTSPLEPYVGGMDDPVAFVQLMEQFGEPAAAGLATMGGTPGGGIEPAPEPEPGPDPGCQPVRTAEQLWEAVAIGIESELAVEGAGDAAFDQSLNLALDCCWPRAIKNRPSAWGQWTCGGWAIDGPPIILAGGCQVNQDYRRTATRSQTRTCYRIRFDCSVTVVTQTRTDTQDQCYREMYDRTGAGCDGATFVVPGAPASPPGCTPNCGPRITSGWTPGC